MPEWAGTREASELLGITLRTLYRLIDEGQLPAYKMGRVIRLKVEDVEDYERRHGGPGGLSDDREPRVPLPSAPAGSMELGIPE